MEYYIIINGAQAGPYPKEQLPMLGIQNDTYVWRQGLPQWVKAAALPELADTLMADSAFGGYARPEEQINPYSGQYPYGQQPPQSPYGRQPYGQSSYGRQTYGQPDPYDMYGREPGPIPHTNWLPWAIVGTVLGALFSCIGMIFGIIGITKAQQANRFYNEGFREDGDRSNSSARTMTIIALVVAAIGAGVSIWTLTGNFTEQLLNLAN